ncbi:asparaginase [Kineococcus rhizosphaerae]|uniref:L-asparaginase n=1 Tax=Kineococcus rhizosphaerae TaxID=559628 RepID=A0A2T0R0I1_9ACTN|nr:asparaginase [Kineococcus rhizosphaerae]PRY12614.1 L-asparaginase [Kineococcus rhizosphaerae]
MPLQLIATGGTISSTGGLGHLEARLGAQDLLATLGGGTTGGDVRTLDLTTVVSSALTGADLLRLHRAVRAALDSGVDGVVVTHGTDAMEETAFLLDLLHDDERPVVLTGAQRAADAVGPDGPANLAAALQLAADPAARGCGVLLAFDGEAYAARGVRKVHTVRAGAFAAPGLGPTHRIAAGRVDLLHRPLRAKPRTLPDDVVDLPRVDVVGTHLGADATLFDAALAAGARGVVVQAMGAGNTPPAVTEAVLRACGAGVPVVVCSRVPEGPVAPVYGSGGSALQRGGAVLAGDLSPWQARTLLAVALADEPHDPVRACATAFARP